MYRENQLPRMKTLPNLPSVNNLRSTWLKQNRQFSHKMRNIKELLNKLEFHSPDYEFITLEEALRGVGDIHPDGKVFRLDLKDDKDASRKLKPAKIHELKEKQQDMDKMVWDMQDALDDLIKESNAQMNYLEDIDELLSVIEGRLSPTEERNAIGTVGSSTQLMAYSMDEIPGRTLYNTFSPRSESVDKYVQVGKPSDDIFSIRELEKKHYRYMLDAFRNLRFKLEISSNIDCIAPHDIEKESWDENTKITITGSTREINEKISSLVFKGIMQNYSSTSTSPTLTIARAQSKASLPSIKSRKPSVAGIIEMKEISIHKKNMKSVSVMPEILKSVELAPQETEIKLACNLRLLNLDPFLITETRDLPHTCLTSTRNKYDEIEYIQWKMPEIADSRFDIDDILDSKFSQERLSFFTYFKSENDPTSDSKYAFEEEVAERLNLYKTLYKHKRRLRKIFLSYNIESMKVARDVLTMNLVSFIRLLSDSMVLSGRFDTLDAVKIFYVAFSHIKSKAQEASKSWLHHLTRSYNFKEIYRLSLSNFIEALIRLVHSHPRFSSLTNMKLHQKFELFYKLYLKPGARISQGMYYIELLKDLHIIEIMKHFTPQLYLMFNSSMTKIESKQVKGDLNDRHRKVELPKLLKLLEQFGILKGLNHIEYEEEEDIEIELINASPELRKISEIKSDTNYPKNKLKRPKRGSIYFPTSLVRKPENLNIRPNVLKNLKNTGLAYKHNILPFSRPVKDTYEIDKLTAFSLYSGLLIKSSGIFLSDTNYISDSDFMLDFTDFLEFFTILGMHFWKTISSNEELSIVSSVTEFLQKITEAFEKHDFGIINTLSKNKKYIFLRTLTADVDIFTDRPLISAAVYPQERFHQRRYSYI
ncbi:unnamed protein product [Blepharisma stoltei]|uniref:Uncharacterized protein n=1 Tax=Blepharisma stoltei TaxID=1481888 RepID=A0AAU9J942_9CILI|nr:unnamed protein product [Blepharisma stoltei]